MSKYVCPKCGSQKKLAVERRPNGDIHCMNCNYKDAADKFKVENKVVQEVWDFDDDLDAESIGKHIKSLLEKEFRGKTVTVTIKEHEE